MLFNPTDIGFILRLFLGSRETVGFKKKLFLTSIALTYYIFVCRSATNIVYDPDTTDDLPPP